MLKTNAMKLLKEDSWNQGHRLFFEEKCTKKCKYFEKTDNVSLLGFKSMLYLNLTQN